MILRLGLQRNSVWGLLLGSFVKRQVGVKSLLLENVIQISYGKSGMAIVSALLRHGLQSLLAWLVHLLLQIWRHLRLCRTIYPSATADVCLISWLAPYLCPGISADLRFLLVTCWIQA
jgi:hypothetical protein